jgi:hypothetical protein
MIEKNDKAALPIMTIIGIFFGIFGLSLLAAIFYTQTDQGRIVNIVCSLIFLIMAGACILISIKQNK